MLTNMDKLYESVAANGPVCVGLDTEISYLPTTDTAKTGGENVVEFNRALIDATKGVAGCYKVQIAYYESLGLEGMKPTPRPWPLSARPVSLSSPISSAAISPRPPRCTPWVTLPAILRAISLRWHPTWVWTPSAPTCLRRKAGQGHVRALPHLQPRREGL